MKNGKSGGRGIKIVTDEREEKRSVRIFNLMLCLAIFFLCVYSIPARCEGPEELNDLEVGFLYYKLSQLPIPWDHFANHYAEYRDAKDEFQRLEVLERIKPVLEKMKNKVYSSNSFIVKFKSRLGEYDFQNNGFPTNILQRTFVPTMKVRSNMKGPDFAIKFQNGQEFSYLKVDPQEARKKVIALRDSREAVIEIEYEAKSAGEDTINYISYRMIDAHIKKLRAYSLKNNVLIGEMSK
jgi:hypothetical protein